MRSAGTTGRRASAVRALRGFHERWTSGRRAFAPAGLIALVIAVSASALLAAADAPHRAKETAATRHTRPDYLLPLGALLRQGWLPQPTFSGDRGSVGVPTGTPQPPTVPDPGQAARQAPAIAPFQGAAGTLTPAGIATLALEHGCDPGAAVTATAIAMAESGGSPSAQGDIGLMTSVWDWSAGLWQIRGLRSERNTGGLRDSVANQQVGNNAAAMHTISQGCTDWTPWSTYNSGAYQQFMTLARQAVQYVVAYFNAHGGHYPPVPAPDPNATIPSGGGGAAAAQGGTARSRSAAPHRRSTTAPARRHSTRPAAGHSTPAPTPTTPAVAPPTSPKVGGPLPTLPVPLPTKSATLPPLPLPTTSLPALSLPPLPKLP